MDTIRGASMPRLIWKAWRSGGRRCSNNLHLFIVLYWLPLYRTVWCDARCDTYNLHIIITCCCWIVDRVWWHGWRGYGAVGSLSDAVKTAMHTQQIWKLTHQATLLSIWVPIPRVAASCLTSSKRRRWHKRCAQLLAICQRYHRNEIPLEPFWLGRA